MENFLLKKGTRSATHRKTFQSHIIAFFSKKIFFSEIKVFSTYYTFFRLFMSAAHKLSLSMIQTHIIVVVFSISYINLCFIMVKTRCHQMRQIYKHCHCSSFCNLIKIDFMCINHFWFFFVIICDATFFYVSHSIGLGLAIESTTITKCDW